MNSRISLSHKKEWNNAIGSDIGWPRDYHPKQSGQEKTTSYDITYMWNLKYDTNEDNDETDSQTQRTDLWFPRGRGWGKEGLVVWD